MATTITILAEDPRTPKRADPAIDAVRDKFKNVRTDHHHFVRASSIRQVGQALEKAAADRVQIIGHGSAGSLALGMFWTKTYRGEKGSYALDSNPLIHGFLAGKVRRDSKVFVLGCSVGEDNDGPRAMVPDGPTLLFDLAQMLGCEVSAPADLISADDFDKNGKFRRTSCLVRVKGFKFEPPNGKPTVQEKEKVGKPSAPPLKIARLEWAPILGERAHRLKGVDVPNGWSKELPGIFDQEIRITCPVLALPEIVCTATWNEQPATAEVLGNWRILRIKCKNDVYHFAASPEGVREVRRLGRKMLAPAFE